MRAPWADRRMRRLLAALLVLVGTLGLALASAGPSTAATTPTWERAGAPLPHDADPGNQGAVLATSCPAPGTCVGVGAYVTGGRALGLVEIEVGGAWQPTAVPAPTGAAANPLEEPTAVDCTSVTACVAVGIYRDSGGNVQGMLWSGGATAGSTWTATEATLPSGEAANPNVLLDSLSCPAAGTCVAVGSYHDSGGQTQGLLLVERAGTWTATEAPLPAGTAPVTQVVQVLSVSCWTTGGCEAGGSFRDTAGNTQGLLLSEDPTVGAGWSADTAPLTNTYGISTAPNPQAVVTGVSCSTTNALPVFCASVGPYTDAAGDVVAFVWPGVGAPLQPASPAPLPSDAVTSGSSPSPGSTLDAVACPSPGSCIAVGSYVRTSNTGSGTAPLIETMTRVSNASWAATTGPGTFDPATATSLGAVSCSWSGSCAAAGVSAGAGGSPAFLETLTGGAWSESAAVLPSDASVPNSVVLGLGSPAANALSCEAGNCAVGGTYANAGGHGGVLDTFPNLTGYQMVAADGGLFAFGVPFFGSMGGQPLEQPVVGMAVVPDSGGYYEVASDGGIFTFGATFYGSMGGTQLNQPVVGIAFDTCTGGYYEVASDGGIFAFGAPFLGSMGGITLNEPVVGIAYDTATGGYYEVASDGGIFAFGAPFQGSMGGTRLNEPVVGIGFG
jgi:hypothetical protein